MDKILSLFKLNKKTVLCISIITIIGIISGSLFIMILSNEDKETVITSITNFFDTLGTIDYKVCLKNSLIINIGLVLLIWLLGISIIGIPIILILYFIKTFTLGFTISSIIKCYGFKGVIYSLFYVFPHQIINVLILAFLSIYAIICSFKIMSSFFKKQTIDFKPLLNKYKYIFVITLLTVILTTLYETFAMPNVLKMVLKIIK